MKNFLIKVAVFAVLLFLLDRGISAGLRLVRPVDYNAFIESKQEFFQRKDNFDVLLLGDSHISDAVDPRILKEELGLTSFNLGIYMAGPYEYYYTLLAACQHMKQKPKMIILGASPPMFTKPALPGKYTPLIIDDETLRWSLSANASDPLWMKYFFSSVNESYLFRSLANKLMGKKYRPTREITAISDGYLEARNQIRGTNWKKFRIKPNKAETAQQIEYFKKILAYAKEQGIAVRIINPPVWFPKIDLERKKGVAFWKFTETLQACANEYDVPVHNIEFNVLRDSLEQKDFLDQDHLNYYGAQKYTRTLVEWLRPTYAQQIGVAAQSKGL
jgi:hypothetical protein